MAKEDRDLCLEQSVPNVRYENAVSRFLLWLGIRNM